MNKSFLEGFKNLNGKIVAVTGSTGGIGMPLCRKLLELNASLILVNRSKERSLEQIAELKNEFKKADITFIYADLSDFQSVKTATEELMKLSIDIFIHNAGVYHIERYITDAGYDNIYTVNFVSPYYIIRSLMPQIKAKNGKVVVMGSIAHRYSKTDSDDIDFRTRKKSSLVYGNAKRYLMFSLYELFKDNQKMLSIVHPGITFTGITDHYPKFIFAIIKNPMKIIFMRPEKACICAVFGVFNSTPYGYWIGPSIFDVWGKMKLGKIKINMAESKYIGRKAEEIYSEQTEKNETVFV